jgi:RNA polymerase sigma-70 factor (ECF subfamily)
MSTLVKTTSNTQLKEIIKGCLRKERKYQFKLYELYFGKMMGVCMRYAIDYDEANELVQQGFIKLYNNLDKYNFNGSFDGWIHRIFINNSIDYIRRNKKKLILMDEDKKLDFLNQDHEEFSLFEKEELDPALVMQAISNLSPAYRTVFNLYVIEDYSHKEIAEMLEISEGTSKSNLSKAKHNLKKSLQTLYNQTHE